MVGAIGPVIAGVLPEWESVSRLQELVDGDAFGEFAASVHDDRMDPDMWKTVLRAESLALLAWVLKRARTALTVQHGAPAADERVLCLLPSYGFALHLVRRAVPFAMLGIRTIASAPTERLPELRQTVGRVTAALALGELLVVSEKRSAELAAIAARDDHPIVFTGRRDIHDSIRRLHPRCRIYGATGTHSLVLGTTGEAVREIILRKRGEGLDRSCSNVGSWATLDPSSGRIIHSRGGDEEEFKGRLTELVQCDRPTVIFTDGSTEELRQASIAGYTVVPYSGGSPTSMVGFGRDPVGGWCGDYAV